MKYGLKIGMEISKMAVTEGIQTLDVLYKAIGCELVEIVRAKGLPDPYVMVVDEEGALKEEPPINIIGSYLYGMHEHGCPIFGNAVIMKEVWTSEGASLEWMTKKELDEMEKKISEEIWPEALASIRKFLKDVGCQFEGREES